MSHFQGFKVQVKLKDGKIIEGLISKCNSKSLSLTDVTFSDGGNSPSFKVKSSRLRDLKVIDVPKKAKKASGKQTNRDSTTLWKDDDDINQDFDFQLNLKNFDKQVVFSKLKQSDPTSTQERLVSSNKIKNTEKLTNEETVTSNGKDEEWSPDDKDHRNYLPITKSINITHLLQQSSTSKSENGEVLFKLQNVLSPRSPSVSKSTVFYTEKSNIPISLATPVQLLEIERCASELFGFNHELSLEHSAIHLCRFIKNKLGISMRSVQNNNNYNPVIVILTSDNRCGSRALSLGRCLASQSNIQCIVMMSCDTVMDKQVENQLNMFTNFGGKIVESISSLNLLLDKLNSSPELVIDAMQGFDCNLYDLINDDDNEQRLNSMIQWCNDQSCPTWSLDIPSGHDASSGILNYDIHVKSLTIISTCWPLSSLKLVDFKQLFVVDVGIPSQCYHKRNSLRKFQNVDLFIADSVVSLIK